MSYRLRSLGAATVLMAAVLPATADPVADFYKDKQISWILSANAGGGYGTYAHAFAPIFSDYIPGKPKIVIQNMPGAGGIRAMNYLMNVAPRDGTTIGLVHSMVPLAPLYGLEGANFDPRQMHWLGSLNTATAMCVAWHASGIETWDDLFKKEFLVGTSGAGGQMETLPAMLNKLFGTNIKIISGYKGGNEVFLAMERGEVHGRCGGLINSIQATRPEWFPQNKVTVPIQLALERNPRFPDVPTVIEFAKDDKTKKVLQLIFSPQGIDRPVLTPPGVPAERVAALRKAFEAAAADPRWLAEAEKQNLETDPVKGEKVARIIADAYSSSPEVIRAAGEATATSSANR